MKEDLEKLKEKEDKLKEKELTQGENLAKLLSKKFTLLPVKGNEHRFEVNPISTGSLIMDYQSGIGGFPRGRIVHIYGSKSCGKTTLAFSVMAQAKKMGLLSVLLEMERAPMLRQRALEMGIDILDSNNFMFDQPVSAEDCLNKLRWTCQAEKFIPAVVVVDSVAGMMSEVDIDKDYTDSSKVAGVPLLLSRSLKEINYFASKNNILVIFTNQVREKVSMTSRYVQEIPPGGKAIGFYASMEVTLKTLKADEIIDPDNKDEDNNKIGQGVSFVFSKNKVAVPHKCGIFDLYFDERKIDNYSALILIATKKDIVHQGGPWFTYKDEKWQGKNKLINELRYNEKLYESIKNDIFGNKK